MANVGHGVLGIVSGLRPFSELIDESISEKLILAEFRPGKVVTGWSQYSGNAYAAPFEYNIDGLRRSVLGAQSLLDTGLTRVESITDCVSTSWSFFYDLEKVSSARRWDDSLQWWDQTVDPWDNFPSLYVNLAGANPASTTVSAFLGYFYASKGCFHPELGPEKLANNGIETWASSSDASSITESGTVARDVAIAPSGSYSARLDWAGSGVSSISWASVPTVAGKYYRACGYYKSNGATAWLRVKNAGATDSLSSDGRSVTGAGTTLIPLSNTFGQLRRFAFDFISPWSAVTLELVGYDGAASGSVWFDTISLKRIYRYNFYSPRLSTQSIPESSTGSNDIFFGGKQIGIGQIQLNNADGGLERIFGDLDWMNRECTVTRLGTFQDGQEILIDDGRSAFKGLVQSYEADDENVAIEVQDIRTFFHAKIPKNSYDDSTFPTMDLSLQGKARPMFFGKKLNITPARIIKDASTFLQTYEIADCSVMTAGIKAIDAVWSYYDSDAAGKKDQTRRKSCEYAISSAITWTTQNSSVTGPTATPNVKKTGGTASTWDAGVYGSVGIANGEYGWVECSPVATNAGIIFGLNADASTGSGMNDIDFALQAYTDGILRVYESGVLKYTGGSYAAGDVLRVAIEDSSGTRVAKYYQNGTLLYTSATAVGSSTLFPDVSIYTSSAIVAGISLVKSTLTRYTTSLTTGQFTMSRNSRIIQVDDRRQFLDWNDGSADRAGKVPLGYYYPDELALAIQRALVVGGAASSPETYTCTYSDATGKFTIGRTTGTFTFKTSTGANKSQNIISLIGFKSDADKSAASTYASDTPIIDATTDDPILRVNARGYIDDASGTYTGVANALIEVGADICRVILNKYLKKPLSIIDDTSFTLARQRAPEPLCIYIAGTPEQSKSIFETLEFSNIANFLIDADGIVYYDVYVGDVPPNITNLFDYDYLDFKIEKRNTDVYSVVKVLHDKDPSTGEFEGRSATESSTELRFQRPDYREFETYIRTADNAQACANRLKELAREPARLIKLTAKGKLVDKRVGQKIALTRRRAMDPNGKLAGAIVRILSMRQSHIDGKTYVECVDDVVTVAGVACITQCQASCEGGNCQESCQTVCQGACEGGVCQDGCQAGCQGACEGGVCQEACQSACQNCQSTCQLSCQTCQSCQGGCQSGCQTGCESGGCQSGCQTCQSGCQTCQDACQSGACQNCQTCQTGCEGGGCQTTCESCQTCQDSCESVCQNCQGVPCQTCQSCQSGCQTTCQTPSEKLQ